MSCKTPNRIVQIVKSKRRSPGARSLFDPRYRMRKVTPKKRKRLEKLALREARDGDII